jgi:hypothetical protein
MATFTDAAGKEWPLALTIGTLEDVQALHGIDLEAAVMEGGDAAIGLLYASPRRLAAVLAVVCDVPADQVKAFCRAITRKQLGPAREAVMSAVADFCLPPAVAEKYASALPSMLAGAMGGAASSVAEAGSDAATNSPVSAV